MKHMLRRSAVFSIRFNALASSIAAEAKGGRSRCSSSFDPCVSWTDLVGKPAAITGDGFGCVEARALP